MSAEADAKGLTRKDKGNYINPGCNAFRAERLKQRDATVEKRVKELEVEIPKAIQKCKTVGDLPACVDDISGILNFMIEVLGVKPENVKLLVT